MEIEADELGTPGFPQVDEGRASIMYLHVIQDPCAEHRKFLKSLVLMPSSTRSMTKGGHMGRGTGIIHVKARWTVPLVQEIHFWPEGRASPFLCAWGSPWQCLIIVAAAPAPCWAPAASPPAPEPVQLCFAPPTPPGPFPLPCKSKHQHWTCPKMV